MTEVIEGSPPPRVIRDWRDWINEFPKVGALAIFCIAAWIAYAIMVHVIGVGSYARGVEINASVQRWFDSWGDKLFLLTSASVVAIIGKRATEKPEVIRAEGEVKAKVVAAAATAEHPIPAQGERGDEP